jgi:hypothetical protein
VHENKDKANAIESLSNALLTALPGFERNLRFQGEGVCRRKRKERRKVRRFTSTYITIEVLTSSRFFVWEDWVGGSAAIDRGVADILTLDDVDDVLGDVSGVVADALQVFGDQD